MGFLLYIANSQTYKLNKLSWKVGFIVHYRNNRNKLSGEVGFIVCNRNREWFILNTSVTKNRKFAFIAYFYPAVLLCKFAKLWTQSNRRGRVSALG
jgi:hypothetical protein